MVTAIIIGNNGFTGQLIVEFIDKHYPEITIVARSNTLQTGIREIYEHRPYLMFVDMELPDGLGCEILSITSSYWCRVIFITTVYHKMHEVLLPAYASYIDKPIKLSAFVTTVSNILPRCNLLNNSRQVSEVKIPMIQSNPLEEMIYMVNNPLQEKPMRMKKVGATLTV